MVRHIRRGDGAEKDGVELLQGRQTIGRHHHAVFLVIIRSPVESLEIELDIAKPLLQAAEHLDAGGDDLGADAVGGNGGNRIFTHYSLRHHMSVVQCWIAASARTELRCDRASIRVRIAETVKRPPTKYRPPRNLPVRSLIQPIIAGPTKPPRLPMALMVAMPAAAAEPDRNMVGMLQSGGFDALIPILTSDRASRTVTIVPEEPAKKSPAAASRQAPTTCQVRSPVRSE